MNTSRRISYAFLCLVSLLHFGVISPRVLRPYWFVGFIYFAVMIVAAWNLCGRAFRTGTERDRRMCLTGGLLILFTLVTALLWVGIAPPFQATPVENRMRYMVLVLGSVTVTAGFLMLETLLREKGEQLLSRLAATFAILAGAAYLIWNCDALGMSVIRARTGHYPPEVIAMAELFDSLLFVACVLTYLATLTFALSMGRMGLLSRAGKIGYTVANLILLGLLLVRGWSFPDPKTLSTAWYLDLGFIAGIPAVPWVMPYLLGVVLLRRAAMETAAPKTA